MRGRQRGEYRSIPTGHAAFVPNPPSSAHGTSVARAERTTGPATASKLSAVRCAGSVPCCPERSQNRRRSGRLALYAVGLVVLTSFFSPHLYSCLNADTSKRWHVRPWSRRQARGHRFRPGRLRTGVVSPGRQGPYVSGVPYPPLVSVLGLPFALLPFDTAYRWFLSDSRWQTSWRCG